MSSLAAARADNFYNPPDWDPNQISRDKFQGSKGHNQYEQKGLIRFEMPFPIFCLKCDKHIDKGVRFNAKKDHIGHYFSTKLWEFSMRCYSCGNMIKIQTDPEACDYKVVEGAKKKASAYNNYTESELDLMKVYDEAHKERLQTDAIYKLEHEHKEHQKIRQEWTRIERLQEMQERDKHDYDNNQVLRKVLRLKKKKKKKTYTKYCNRCKKKKKKKKGAV
ncbi:hypothetical protein RFI_33688 [Reticulomyxa filosa]|uniref:Coiled-coil domain-containing protein n=1 Tax=Reticulomyxa filosa TaxID=46433 RepID=X6LQ05_RETFI|nr:hypothetical protein RFI_33688 [Reticulomyxa filosa]|eukprot:ETO03714.1 hypothetical protein RFI_33688 [Reticulomyxa filosa]